MCDKGKMWLDWDDEDSFTQWITQWLSGKLKLLQKYN